VGKWRCSACGAMNGVENETAKLVKEVTQGKAPVKANEVTEEPEASDGDEGEESSGAGADADNVVSPAAATRSKTKGKKGKK